jgi:NAD(P)-dependent dehydrogenase (short-subunit alcohol dehydrogenase family)
MLLNVAGVGVAAPFQNTTTAEYRQMVDVNFLGLLYPINAALPAMKRQGAGQGERQHIDKDQLLAHHSSFGEAARRPC